MVVDIDSSVVLWDGNLDSFPPFAAWCLFSIYKKRHVVSCDFLEMGESFCQMFCFQPSSPCNSISACLFFGENAALPEPRHGAVSDGMPGPPFSPPEDLYHEVCAASAPPRTHRWLPLHGIGVHLAEAPCSGGRNFPKSFGFEARGGSGNLLPPKTPNLYFFVRVHVWSLSRPFLAAVLRHFFCWRSRNSSTGQ